MEFHLKRRQQFLNEHYYEYFCKKRTESLAFWKVNLPANGNDDQHRKVLAANIVADETVDLFLLKYTGGESLDELRKELTNVVEMYERYAKLLRTYQGEPDFPVFGFQEIADFERIAQLISFAILFHRRELVPRIHALIADSAYDGQDAMYEELISHVLPERPYLEAWYHQSPYLHLLSATDLESSQEKIEQMQQYLQVWYKAMKAAPWHDTHFDTTENGGAYVGYWAIEAGAVAYLLELDDSSFREHIVYPKDLVDYARELDNRPLTISV